MPVAPASHPSTVAKLFYAAGIFLLISAIFMHYQTGWFGDKHWEMLYAEMWLTGRKLYVDLFPVSPPLIFLLYSIPATLSIIPGFPYEFHILELLGMALVAFCIFLSLRLITYHPAFAQRTKRVEFVLMLCFVLMVQTSALYFLDREHLFVVLTLPYLLRFMPTLAKVSLPLPLKIIIGILAGLGFCIKPYCLILLTAIQLLYFLQQKSLRILISAENWSLYAVGLAYALSIWVFWPQYYFIVVPMALATYSATRNGIFLPKYLEYAAIILGCSLAMFRLRHTSPLRRDIYYLLALCAACLLYALANNNWIYAYYPLNGLTLVVAAFIFWEFVFLKEENEKKKLPTGAFRLGVFLCLLPFLMRAFISTFYFFDSVDSAKPFKENEPCFMIPEFVAEVYTPKRWLSFGTLSIDFDRWTHLSHDTASAWETRFPQLWMLPKFLLAGEHFKQEHQWILDYVAEGLAQDMDTRNPDVMFVDDADVFYTAHVHIDLVKYFSFNKHFQDAWSHYRYADHIDVCTHSISYPCKFDVYRRIEAK